MLQVIISIQSVNTSNKKRVGQMLIPTKVTFANYKEGKDGQKKSSIFSQKFSIIRTNRTYCLQTMYVIIKLFFAFIFKQEASHMLSKPDLRAPSELGKKLETASCLQECKSVVIPLKNFFY